MKLIAGGNAPVCKASVPTLKGSHCQNYVTRLNLASHGFDLSGLGSFPTFRGPLPPYAKHSVPTLKGSHCPNYITRLNLASHEFDPFRVGQLPTFPGALPPAIDCVPFRDKDDFQNALYPSHSAF